MCEFIVIDSPMGSGKTSWAIKNMMEQDNPFIFFTPFLSETDRIKKNIQKEIKLPLEGAKQATFKQFLEDGDNIASTHALLGQVNLEEHYDRLIREHRYDCYLDETVNAIEEIHLSKKNFNQVTTEYVEILPDGSCRLRLDVDSEDIADDRFADIIEAAKAGTLFVANKKLFITMFPIEKLMLFDRVYIMTYMFESSTMAALFKIRGIQYSMWHIEKKNGEYTIAGGKSDDATWKRHVASLIHIYEPKKELDYSLSKSWYEKADKEKLSAVRKDMYNVLHHKFDAKVSDTIWSTFSDYKKDVQSVRYPEESCFVACNCRATNDFSNRHYLAYMVNINQNPMVSKWLTSRSIPFDNDGYALSTMIQWIWRSAIRNDEEIWIYLPSQRMRSLLITWLEN